MLNGIAFSIALKNEVAEPEHQRIHTDCDENDHTVACRAHRIGSH